jgi:hypothetical protein
MISDEGLITIASIELQLEKTKSPKINSLKMARHTIFIL